VQPKAGSFENELDSQLLYPEDIQSQSSHGSDKTITNNYRPDFDSTENEEHEEEVTVKKLDKGKGKAIETSPVNDMFVKIPVQPVTASSAIAASLPGSMARSKSQLTLLLQKDRARSEEQVPRDKRGRMG